MLSKKILVTLIVVAAGFAGSTLHADDEPVSPTANKQLRVGVYDSRSVALAWGRSKSSNRDIDQLMAEAKKAEKEKDWGRLEVLKKKGSARQNLRHMQVFGNAPIHDILADVQSVLEQQARTEKLDLIVRDIDIALRGPSVELVDITDRLVASCQPTPETLSIIEAMKKHPPLPLEQFPIEHNDHGTNDKDTSNPAAEEIAVAAARQWLELIDTGQYADSWKKSSAHFQAVVPEERWLAEMRNLRTPLGKLVSRNLKSQTYRTELPDAPIGEYVVIQFQTEYEKDKEVSETVTPVREEDGSWKVDGYYLR